ncbi:MAG: hydrogenase maturation protease [Candidatus Acidiferrum sp.]
MNFRRTSSFTISEHFADYDAIILIDSVSAKAPAGGIRLFRKPKLVRTSIPQRFSFHDQALVEALLFAELSGKCPGEVLLVGVVSKTTELGCCLSDEVRSAVVPSKTPARSIPRSTTSSFPPALATDFDQWLRWLNAFQLRVSEPAAAINS